MALFRRKPTVLPPSISDLAWESTDWIGRPDAPANLVVGEQHNQDALATAVESRGHNDRSCGVLIPVRVEFLREKDNRSSYQAEAPSDQLSTTLRESLTTDQLVEAWGDTVNDALQPSANGIWIRET